MIFSQVESELAKRENDNDPITVAIAGTGFIGRGLINQLGLLKGIKLAAVANRTIDKALLVLENAGIPLDNITVCKLGSEIKHAKETGNIIVASDILLLVETGVDIIIDATGDPQTGAALALSAINNRVNYIAAPEMDSVAGLSLNKIATEKGVVYSGADGDEPGVTMGLFCYVSMLGFKIVAAGKFKGFYNRYANPDTVKPWSDKFKQNPYMISSFTDGTKMNIEMALLANASGLYPDKRGMHFPQGNLEDVPKLLCLKDQGGVLNREGVVEVVQNVEPSGGVFVVASTTNIQIKNDLQYLKMGDGPNYLFYRPYHLCAIEMVISIIRAVIHGEASIAPRSRVAGVLTIAKKPLEAGEILDNIGGYTFYGQIDLDEVIRKQGLLPAVLAPGTRLIKNKTIDEPITLDDVEIDQSSQLYKLWQL